MSIHLPRPPQTLQPHTHRTVPSSSSSSSSSSASSSSSRTHRASSSLSFSSSPSLPPCSLTQVLALPPPASIYPYKHKHSSTDHKESHTSSSHSAATPSSIDFFSSASAYLPPLSSHPAIQQQRQQSEKGKGTRSNTDESWRLDSLLLHTSSSTSSSSSSSSSSPHRAHYVHKLKNRNLYDDSDDEEDSHVFSRHETLIKQIREEERNSKHARKERRMLGEARGRGDDGVKGANNILSLIGERGKGKGRSKHGEKIAQLFEKFEREASGVGGGVMEGDRSAEGLMLSYLPSSPPLQSPALSRVSSMERKEQEEKRKDIHAALNQTSLVSLPVLASTNARAEHSSFHTSSSTASSSSTSSSSSSAVAVHPVVQTIHDALSYWASLSSPSPSPHPSSSSSSSSSSSPLSIESFSLSTYNKLFDACLSYSHWFSRLVRASRSLFQKKEQHALLLRNRGREERFIEEMLQCCREGSLRLEECNLTKECLPPLFLLLQEKVVPSSFTQRHLLFTPFSHFTSLNLSSIPSQIQILHSPLLIDEHE